MCTYVCVGVCVCAARIFTNFSYFLISFAAAIAAFAPCAVCVNMCVCVHVCVCVSRDRERVSERESE